MFIVGLPISHHTYGLIPSFDNMAAIVTNNLQETMFLLITCSPLSNLAKTRALSVGRRVASLRKKMLSEVWLKAVNWMVCVYFLLATQPIVHRPPGCGELGLPFAEWQLCHWATNLPKVANCIVRG